MIRRILDLGMVASLLCLMAYQVTGRALHEWIGIGMIVLVITHVILNRKWYGAVFKGKYDSYRIVTTAVNALLLVSFVVTAFCGMAMSGNAVPFMHGIIPISYARLAHLSMTHWSFVLMGVHLGMHIPVMAANMKLSGKTKAAIATIFCCISGAGLFFFLRKGMLDYMFFQVIFAFFDHEKTSAVLFIENVLMLSFWAFIGCQCATLFMLRHDANKKKKLLSVVFIVAAVTIGMVLNMAFR